METKQVRALRTTLLFLLLVPSLMMSQNFTTSTWESLGPEGGYLTSLAQNPANGDLFTVTYEYPARMFKSTNNGDRWNVIGQIQDYIYYLAIDPLKPTTMYAVPSYLGYASTLGIYKSMDGGLSCVPFDVFGPE